MKASKFGKSLCNKIDDEFHCTVLHNCDRNSGQRSDYASNVFIAHIETISTRNASRPFSALLQSVLNSALDVSAAYKDRFRQCLDEKRCLDDGPTRLHLMDLFTSN
jgi:hypothetical protein